MAIAGCFTGSPGQLTAPALQAGVDRFDKGGIFSVSVSDRKCAVLLLLSFSHATQEGTYVSTSFAFLV
jgi:hypothetical protein